MAGAASPPVAARPSGPPLAGARGRRHPQGRYLKCVPTVQTTKVTVAPRSLTSHSMNLASRFLMLACLAPLIACGEPEGATQYRLPEWTLDVEQQVGGEQLPLSFVTELAIGPAVAGPCLIIPSSVRPRSAGGTVMPIGRQGGGPAEYRYVNQIGFEGDTLSIGLPTPAECSSSTWRERSSGVWEYTQSSVEPTRSKLAPSGPFRTERGSYRSPASRSTRSSTGC